MILRGEGEDGHRHERGGNRTRALTPMRTICDDKEDTFGDVLLISLRVTWTNKRRPR